MAPELDVTDYAGPIWVTLAYLSLYYGLISNVLRVKLAISKLHRRRHERFDRYNSQDPQLLAADRAMLNTLEHMPPFLTLLWLNAVFVGTLGATVAGSIYVATRTAYPFLVGSRLSRGIPNRVLFATYTGYAVLAYFAFRLTVTLIS